MELAGELARSAFGWKTGLRGANETELAKPRWSMPSLGSRPYTCCSAAFAKPLASAPS